MDSQENMSQGNPSQNEPTRNPSQNEQTRKRGRPRRVLFEELREPETPNNMDDTIPRRVVRDPSPPARRVPRHRTPPRNEPATDQLLTLLRQALNQGHPQEQQAHRQEEESDDKMMARFLRFNPPKFNGEPDDRRAEFWLAEVEKIFKVLNYSDPRKVK